MTLGGRTWVRRGGDVKLDVTIDLPAGPNANGQVPRLAKVDLISGPVTGTAADRDTLSAPRTTVVTTFGVTGSTSRRRVRLDYTFPTCSSPSTCGCAEATATSWTRQTTRRRTWPVPRTPSPICRSTPTRCSWTSWRAYVRGHLRHPRSTSRMSRHQPATQLLPTAGRPAPGDPIVVT